MRGEPPVVEATRAAEQELFETRAHRGLGHRLPGQHRAPHTSREARRREDWARTKTADTAALVLTVPGPAQARERELVEAAASMSRL